MELNSSVNTFIGGMNLDSDISLLKENQYTYAENIRLLANADSTTGVLQNRDCLKRFVNATIGETILGLAVTRVFKNDAAKECIVVITKIQIGSDIKNNIELFYIDETQDNWCTSTFVIEKADLGWTDPVKIIPNYESDTVSKIYVSDGVHNIKVINLNTTYDSTTLNNDSFDIAPNCVLNKPKLIKMISGNLEVGAVQYAYQLFTKHGAESSISPVSQQIIIPKKSGSSSKDVYGGNKGELSQFGCQIKIDFEPSNEFDHIRIYRIRYESNNAIAKVEIISETGISGDYIIYNDISESMISEITVDEFNMLTLKTFVPKTIEKHENRLFAANIKENTWNPDYDARAFRCNVSGYIELHHSDQMLNRSGQLGEDGTINGEAVSETHDCINPSNSELNVDQNSYMYGIKNGNTFLGGTGKNISYEFCFTDVICSSGGVQTVEGKTYPEYSLDLKSTHKTQNIHIYDININTIAVKQYDSDIYQHYGDGSFTADFLGYQRDEIYRFGIIFYNKKGQKTNVYWIGDIRMPSYHANAFTFNGYTKQNDQVEMLGRAMGVKFTIKNMPENAVSYEIVRCPRTEIDRTIITQALLSGVIRFDTWRAEDQDFGEADIRPMLLPNLYSEYRVVRPYIVNDEYQFETYTFDVVDNYYELISPEICVNKNNIVDNLKNNYFVTSHTLRTTQYLDNEQQWGIRQDKIYTLADAKEELVKNDNTFGGYVDLYGTQYLKSGVSHNVGYGKAILQKYYKKGFTNMIQKSASINNAIIPQILPLKFDHTEAKSYSSAIGDKIYTNTTIGGKSAMNTHGICAIIQTDQALPYTEEQNEAVICNVKQFGVLYGGNTYNNRVNSNYMSCVGHKCYDNSICVFGGDTYLGIFDYLHTSMRQYKSDSNDHRGSSTFVNCYIPLESTVNMYMFNNDSYSKTVEGMTGQNLLQNEPTVTGNYAQTKPMYEYNSAYSTDANAQIFVPELLYTDEDPIFETRITCSELKTNNEIIDSWTKFKFANYLDVDNQYGKITNLKSFNGKLLFWQDSSVGIASVNERSLIQDNNISSLTLGTGGILVRYDYYTTLNGSYIVNDKSICNSASTLYWYDTDKHEICAINNTVIELSKNKGVKSWCNKLLGRTDTIGWYDWKYNEVLFQNKSEDVDRSIVFNEQLNVFTGFYTYPVEHVAQMTNTIITFDESGNIYLHDSDVNYDPFESKLTYKINKGYPETKVFDNVWFDAEFSTNEVLKSVVFKTKTQETNPISFNEIENREDTYRFPIPRDKNGVARMRGKYLICDYTFDCINDGDFKIPYIKTTFRISRV